MKNLYTIFGQGFVGNNIIQFLKKKKYKVFVPKKGKYKFNKNLYNIIYCIGSDNWIKDPSGSYEANLGIVPKIIFNNKYTSFTFISSTRVYLGHGKKKTNEKSSVHINPNIRNFYFNSLKLTAESLCLSLPNKKIKVVRISNLFGDNFTNQIYLLPTLIRNSTKNKKINILINKKSSKDFIHIHEALDVLIKIIKKGKYRLYNIASGKNIELSKISQKIKKITSCKVDYKNQNKLIKEPIIDISRIKKEFNFKAKKDLINSLDQLITNYKNYA
jgi:nucleoside-diphosphate-sugar epimerase